MKNSRSLFLSIITAAAVIFAGGAFGIQAYADEAGMPAAEILITDDPAEIALSVDDVDLSYCEPVMVDTVSGEVTKGDGETVSMQEAFGVTAQEEEQLIRGGAEEIADYFEQEPQFSVDGAGEETVQVSFPFLFKRLGVFLPEGSLDGTYGAVRAVYYQTGQNYILDYATEAEAAEAYEILIGLFGEACVVPDLPVVSSQMQMDPDVYDETDSLSYSWGADMMQLDLARDLAKEEIPAEKTITIAVLDSGINTAHEMFEGRILDSSASILEGTDSIEDASSHGTHVAGIIADCTPENVKLMVIRVLDENGRGGVLELINGILYASATGADILNLSLAVDMKTDPSAAVNSVYASAENALKRAVGYGSLCICAAGNSSRKIEDYMCFPAVSENACTVSAIDSAKDAAGYSNYGESVDITAPGSSIYSAYINGPTEYTGKSGTSMSCPHISAACALIKLYSEGIANEEILELLQSVCIDLGDEGRDIHFGCGLPVFENGLVPRKGSLEEAELTLSQTSYNYLAVPREPEVTVTLNGLTLMEGRDYTVSYHNNVDAGTAEAVVEGTGWYSGTASAGFTIRRRSLSLCGTADLKWESLPFTGEPRTQTNAAVVTSRLGSRTFTLVKGTDYKISYTNNTDVGTAEMILTGKGNYRGTLTAEFKIVPAKRKLTKVTAGSSRFKAFWEEDSTQISGYQLQYSLYSDFSVIERTVAIEDPGASLKTVKKGPESGKTYYVRLRAYKKGEDRNYYSSWSPAKTVKIL